MDSFSIHLLSNSSMEMFPDNTAANFNVNLPKKIILNGNWKVALTEIQYPNTFHNVTRHSSKIIFKFFNNSSSYTKTFQISEKEYKDIHSLVEAVNFGFQSQLGTSLIKYLPESNRIKILKKEINKAIDPISDVVHPIINLFNESPKSVEKFDSSKLKIYFENKLALQLGFLPENNILDFDESPSTTLLEHGLYEQMFVYCDIIDSQIIGHTEAQVLKIFTCQTLSEKNLIAEKEFRNLEYVNVVKKEFDTIEININTITGYSVPFNHGISILKLQFVKISNF